MKWFITVLLLTTFAKSHAQFDVEFSPNHDITSCGANDVYFVCTSPAQPDLIAWDFGDGETSNLINPKHHYGIPGHYTVSLTITKNGVMKTLTKDSFVHIKSQPIAKFSIVPEQVVLPMKRKFRSESELNCDTSTSPLKDTLVSYLWTFENEEVEGDSVESYHFSTYGDHEVKLKITNVSGCWDEHAKIVKITPEIAEPEPVGIGEHDAQQMKVYPNPFDHTLFVEPQIPMQGQVNAAVFDVTGKQVYASEMANAGTIIALEDLNLLPGFYILRLWDHQQMCIKKIQAL